MSKEEEEDDDEYEEPGGGSQLLGFMFGNVDNTGDLDVDYLDEDAKEHLAALADELGPSLAEIELIKSSPAPTDTSEQDYDEKAENAVDYEDIDEQYDGPEVQATTEEHHFLPKNEFFSSSSFLALFENKTSVFDEENYDEDEGTMTANEAVAEKVETEISAPPGEQLKLIPVEELPLDENLTSVASPEADDLVFEFGELQEQPNSEDEQTNNKTETSLPVLCIEDGMVILKFSEIFGVHEPRKRFEKRDHHKRVIGKDRPKPLNFADIIEEDEEVFLRNSFQNLGVADNYGSSVNIVELDHQLEGSGGLCENAKDPCRHAQPMKDGVTIDRIHYLQSPPCPDIYPFDHQDWEDNINWGNSPLASHDRAESCVISTSDVEENTDTEIRGFGSEYVDQNGSGLLSGPVMAESFGSRKLSVLRCDESFGSSHLQEPRDPESNYKNEVTLSGDFRAENGLSEVCKSDASRCFNKLNSLNKEFQEGTWLSHIIWDSSENIPKPKLILDLQDQHMLFEALDQNFGEQLRCHAGAMVINRPSQTVAEGSFDLQNQGAPSGGRFNISNDKYYSNRKSSQQTKSHAKKRALMNIKILHSLPALKLQTMKPKLSNKEIANFHRPKALWFPRCNQITATNQGAPCSHGPMRVILMSLGGKPIIFNVNAEETSSAVKLRAAKKLDLRQSENLKIFYCGRELDDEKSFAMQGVCPNSLLHVLRTRIHLWPRAQKLPGENKPMRPPGAFKKKSELSVKEGHVFLMEYCEERPLLLGNVGMGARLCTYYQKTAPGDQTSASLRNGNSGLGMVLALDPSDKSPFLGDISPGCTQSCIETNMYRAPIFPHKLSTVDFLLVRSAKGMISLRRIDKLYAVGQQEPHMEVLSPGTKNVQTYLINRMLVYVYREFLAKEKPGFLPHVRFDELIAQFPGLTETIIRKRLKQFADLKKMSNGRLLWVKKGDFRIASEDELRRMLAPENVCSYESMQAGLYRLKHLGISRLTHPVGLSTAMNQLPDEAITLAAASHIERELQITSWNLTSNFVACTSQDRENIERLEITGVGDPSGRGLGFSYVRVTPKAPIASTMAKKKAAAAKGSSAVTGTDADLRRLSMDAAREVLLKFKVPEEQIDKLTRWHRIALVRKLSSEQAASGVKVEAPMLSKFARGQRMSFLQLQQQTREKCQEIWDRQVQSLSAANGDENDSDLEANSDLDSFAGDLENLLDAEECDEEDDGSTKAKAEKIEGVRGLKMRRCPSQAQIEEENEDDQAEASLIQRLLEDNEAEMKKKKKLTGTAMGSCVQFSTQNADLSLKKGNLVGQTIMSYVDGSFSLKEHNLQEPREVESLHFDSSLSGKVRLKKGIAINDDTSAATIKKKGTVPKDGIQVVKEKKSSDKPVRENIVCGACGQIGHMRTNKNCPKYRDDVETSEMDSFTSRYNISDPHQLPVKTPPKKLTTKLLAKPAEVEVPPKVGIGVKPQAKILPVKFKCGPTEKLPEKNLHTPQTSGKQIIDVDAEVKSSGKINRLVISSKSKTDDIQYEVRKPSVVIRLPIDTEKDQPRKKIIIKQPKVSSLESDRQPFDNEIDHGFKKIKKITELSSLGKQKQQEISWFTEEAIKRAPAHDRRLWDEDEKRKGKERAAEKRTRNMFEDSSVAQEKLWRSYDTRGYEETIGKEESSKTKKKKKKKKKPDFTDEYLEHRPYRNDRRMPERDRVVRRRTPLDSGPSEYMPSAKRRRGGEVELSNILENIVESLKSAEVSFLFRKPVTKKEAPDYFDIIESPMDLSTIRDKVRNMEYKSREDFRHDVFQITFNAHLYNDKRNPHIPPLADQLLELCDYHLEERNEELTDAEETIRAMYV